jgi:hypothetical protein
MLRAETKAKPKCAHCGGDADVNRVGDQVATVTVWGQSMCYPCFNAWERECPHFGADEAACRRYEAWTRDWCAKARVAA